MRIVVVTPPAPVVAWEDADKHLKLGGDTSQQTEVEAMIAAATGHLDGPGGWLGRALGVQTLEAYLPCFGTCGFIPLPYPPAIDIVALDYVDDAGTTIALDSGAYELRGNMLRPSWPTSWPLASWRGAHGETVRVRYRAGYVVDPAADPLAAALPAPIRAAILLMVGDLYRYRETAMMVTGMAVPMSTTVENLLAPFRVYA